MVAFWDQSCNYVVQVGTNVLSMLLSSFDTIYVTILRIFLILVGCGYLKYILFDTIWAYIPCKNLRTQYKIALVLVVEWC